ncbi:MAG: PocR ligand-binding domain-containing protein [Bryobacterales bacterium]|nr:PocR ligand-binding domain-containing protein [Bryobacteraceae bacterium]MDW8131398.1 PocR ligand-binding domain-containing protein [Bryobacterales bacterium]
MPPSRPALPFHSRLAGESEQPLPAAPSGAPGVTFLPDEEKDLFIEAFHKELDFLELLLLLVNRSFPFKNVDLIWAGEARAGRVTTWHGTGTMRALRNPHLRPLGTLPRNPNPRFCNLVNDYGRREAETCLLSDLAAAERARRSGRVLVYTCHAGITDIVVPVRSGPHHLATLHCGQCLREPPSEAGFARIARRVARLQHVDLAELKKAYYELPVIPMEQIRSATRVLSLFADSLGRLWERLRDAVRFQRQRLRQTDLLRLEFAHLVLAGTGPADRERVRGMLRRLGLRQWPNRVLVVHVEPGSEPVPGWTSYDVALAAAWHAVESVVEKTAEATCVHLRPYGICVFFRDPDEQRKAASDLRARSLAQRIVYAVQSRTGLRARAGIGSGVRHWRLLAQSYQEAREALVRSSDAVAFFRPSRSCFRKLRDETENVARALERQDWTAAEQRIAAFPALVFHDVGGGPESLHAARHILLSMLEVILHAAQRLGCDVGALDRLRERALTELDCACSHPALERAFLQATRAALEEMGSIHRGKHEKIVERARRMIEWAVEHPEAAAGFSLQSVASRLGVSAGHLSRTFSRIMGVPFREYWARKRLERARALLLDPMMNVSQVAEACGYPSAAYFTRVFRKAIGCTPGRFARDPRAALS